MCIRDRFTTFNTFILLFFIVKTPLYVIIKPNWRRSPNSSSSSYLISSMISSMRALNKFMILIKSFFVFSLMKSHLLQLNLSWPNQPPHHVKYHLLSLHLKNFFIINFIFAVLQSHCNKSLWLITRIKAIKFFDWLSSH